MDVVETEETRHFTGIERNLGVSPIDMRQRTFATAMRGYDRQEVTAFLTRPRPTTKACCARTIACARRSCG